MPSRRCFGFVQYDKPVAVCNSERPEESQNRVKLKNLKKYLK